MMRLAVHEAAHIVIALAHGVRAQYATVAADATSKGHVWCPGSVTDVGVDKSIVTLLAGAAAERRYARLNGIVLLNNGDASDLAKVQPLIGAMSGEFSGHSLATWRRRADDAVTAQWPWICRVAEALLSHEHLSADEVLALRGAPSQGARVADPRHDSSEPLLGEAHAGAVSKDLGSSKDGRISKRPAKIAPFEIFSSLGERRT